MMFRQEKASHTEKMKGRDQYIQCFRYSSSEDPDPDPDPPQDPDPPYIACIKMFTDKYFLFFSQGECNAATFPSVQPRVSSSRTMAIAIKHVPTTAEKDGSVLPFIMTLIQYH